MPEISARERLNDLSTEDLHVLHDRLRKTKLMSDGNIKGKARKLKELTKDLGEFTPEKEAELTIVNFILSQRRAVEQALMGIRREENLARAAATNGMRSAANSVSESPLSFAETQEAYTEAFRMLLEHADAQYPRLVTLLQPAKLAFEHLGGWLESWPPPSVPQDGADAPYLVASHPSFMSEDFPKSLAMIIDSNIGNPHLLLRVHATPEWRAIAMTTALTHLYFRNQSLTELYRKFPVHEPRPAHVSREEWDRRIRQMLDHPDRLMMLSIVDSKSIIGGLHAANILSQNRLFDVVSREFEAHGWNAERLILAPDDACIALMRRLDLLITSVPPRSSAEAKERFALYIHLWQLLAAKHAIPGGMELFHDYSLADSSALFPVMPSERWRQLSDRYCAACDSPVEMPVVLVQEAPEQPGPATDAKRSLALAHDYRLQVIEGLPRSFLSPEHALAKARERIASGKGAGLHVLQTAVCLNSWIAQNNREGEFADLYRAFTDPAMDHNALERARFLVDDIVQRLQMQAFHPKNLQRLSVEDTIELVIAVVFLLENMETSIALGEEQGRLMVDLPLTENVLYALSRETWTKHSAFATALERIFHASQRTLSHVQRRAFMAADHGWREHLHFSIVEEELRKATADGDTQGDWDDVCALPSSFRLLLQSSEGTDPMRCDADPQLPRRLFVCLYDSTSSIVGTVSEVNAHGEVSGSYRPSCDILPPIRSPELRERGKNIRTMASALIMEQWKLLNLVCPAFPLAAFTEGKATLCTLYGKFFASFARREDAEKAAYAAQSEILDIRNLPYTFYEPFCVPLPTVAQLEDRLFRSMHVAGAFFSGRESGEQCSHPMILPPSISHKSAQTDVGPKSARGRMEIVRDVLLKTRMTAEIAFDSDAEVRIEGTGRPNFTQVRSGHFVILTLPNDRQLFVSDDPPSTYVCRGNRVLELYTRRDGPTPRSLQGEDEARPIHFQNEVQFEASLTQALTTPNIAGHTYGSIEALVAAEGETLRGRILAVVRHINTLPDRTRRIEPCNMTFGVLRGEIPSGSMAGEMYCGHTIGKEFARMAGYEDPISYALARDVFNEIVRCLYPAECTAKNH